MSDLISRSALIESLIHCDGLGRKSLEAVLKTIEEQPNAYDVDKVVKELERHVRYCELCHKEFKNGFTGSIYKTKIDTYKNAIEIVKGGGVNA